MALASADLHTGRYGGMCPQSNLAFSLEEAPTFGRGSSLRLEVFWIELKIPPVPLKAGQGNRRPASEGVGLRCPRP